MIENDHGAYEEISTEKEVMKLTTTSKYVVVHFFHKDFRRCDIMDKHLRVYSSAGVYMNCDVENGLLSFSWMILGIGAGALSNQIL